MNKNLRFITDVLVAPRVWCAQKSIVVRSPQAVPGVPRIRIRQVRLRFFDGRVVWLGLN